MDLPGSSARLTGMPGGGCVTVSWGTESRARSLTPARPFSTRAQQRRAGAAGPRVGWRQAELPLPRSLGPLAGSHSSFQKLLKSLLGWVVLPAPLISGVRVSPLGVCGPLPAAQRFLEGRTALLVTCSGHKPQPLPVCRGEGQNAMRTGLSRSPFHPRMTSAGWVHSRWPG